MGKNEIMRKNNKSPAIVEHEAGSSIAPLIGEKRVKQILQVMNDSAEVGTLSSGIERGRTHAAMNPVSEYSSVIAATGVGVVAGLGVIGLFGISSAIAAPILVVLSASLFLTCLRSANNYCCTGYFSTRYWQTRLYRKVIKNAEKALGVKVIGGIETDPNNYVAVGNFQRLGLVNDDGTLRMGTRLFTCCVRKDSTDGTEPNLEVQFLQILIWKSGFMTHLYEVTFIEKHLANQTLDSWDKAMRSLKGGKKGGKK